MGRFSRRTICTFSLRQFLVELVKKKKKKNVNLNNTFSCECPFAMADIFQKKKVYFFYAGNDQTFYLKAWSLMTIYKHNT